MGSTRKEYAAPVSSQSEQRSRSPFWRYFRDTLNWLPIQGAGPLAAIARGLALHLDEARSDILWLREQYHPATCEDEAVAGFGKSRRVIRNAKENPDAFRARVTNAWNWHLLGGKTLGLPEILNVYGFDVEAIENLRLFSKSRWAEFMVRLKTPDTAQAQSEQMADITTIVWLVNEYKPARSRFFRLYNDSWDRRPITLAVGPRLGAGWLSLWSGVELADCDFPTIVSFGMRSRCLGECLLTRTSRAAVLGSIAGRGTRRLNAFMLGKSRFSDTFIRRHAFSAAAFICVQNAENDFFAHRWSGPWNGVWRINQGFGRRIPALRTRILGFARAQAVPGHRQNGLLGFGRLGAVARALVVDASPRLGNFRLSRHGPIVRSIPLLDYQRQAIGFAGKLKRFDAPLAGLAALVSWLNAGVGRVRIQAGQAAVNMVQGETLASKSGPCRKLALQCMQQAPLIPNAPDRGGHAFLALSGHALRQQSWFGRRDGRKWWDYTGHTTIKSLED